MHKFRICLLSLLCLLLLGGCSQNQPSQQQEPLSAQAADMTIQTAVLSRQEQQLLSLVDAQDYIFTYNADDDLHSASVFCYSLAEDGQWQLVSSSHHNVRSADGRLALTCSDLSGGMRICFQSADGAIAASRKTIPQQQSLGEGFTRQTIAAEQPQTIIYEQELPLILQYAVPQEQSITYKISDFNHPERFTQQGLHHVYALTVRFSRNQLGNNPLPEESADNPAAETTPAV